MRSDDGDVGDHARSRRSLRIVHFSVDIARVLPQYLVCKAVQPLQVEAATESGHGLKSQRRDKYGYKEKGCQEEKEKVVR